MIYYRCANNHGENNICSKYPDFYYVLANKSVTHVHVHVLQSPTIITLRMTQVRSHHRQLNHSFVIILLSFWKWFISAVLLRLIRRLCLKISSLTVKRRFFPFFNFSWGRLSVFKLSHQSSPYAIKIEYVSNLLFVRWQQCLAMFSFV